MDAFEQPALAEETNSTSAHGNCAEGRRRPRRMEEPFSSRIRGAGPAAPGLRVAAAIEAALLPRLVMVHGARDAGVTPLADAAVAALVEPFTTALMVDDEAASARGLLQHLRDGGAGFETICLDVMAPAARRLGMMWEADDCDFALVTLGLSRLHRLMRELDARFTATAIPMDPGRVAILAVTPGEQHVFGLAMVGDFLRRAGWEIHDSIGASNAEILDAVRRTRFSVAALSCSTPQGLEGLAARIGVLRAASRNRDLGVLVGGLVFVDNPGVVIRVGADAMAQDARAAVRQAERLLVQSRAAAPAG
jgi:methanogenic corrinoid protein MtbC1